MNLWSLDSWIGGRHREISFLPFFPWIACHAVCSYICFPSFPFFLAGFLLPSLLNISCSLTMPPVSHCYIAFPKFYPFPFDALPLFSVSQSLRQPWYFFYIQAIWDQTRVYLGAVMSSIKLICLRGTSKPTFQWFSKSACIICLCYTFSSNFVLLDAAGAEKMFVH